MGASASATSASRRYTVLAVLTLAYMLNFVDRQLLAVLAQPIKAELRLSDTQLGLLTGLAFALFYTFFGVPLANLADRGNRSRLIAAACALWSVFTIATGFAAGFLSLAIARIGVGVGEAGASPPSYSVLADYFPPRLRGRVLAVYSLGVPLGMLVGVAGAARIASAYGWRTAFVVIGGVGLAMAPLLVFLVPEPVRGQAEILKVGGAEDASFKAALLFFLRSRILLFNALAGAVSGAACYGLINWAPAYLQRVQGMSLPEVSAYYSVASAGAIGAGIWAGGLLVDRLGATKPALVALVPAAGNLMAIPFLFAFTSAANWRDSLLWMLAPFFMGMFSLAPVLTITQNITPPRFRATCSAILLFMLNLVGLGVGPLFVGLVSDRLEPQLGPAALGCALTWLTPILLIAVMLYCVTAWYMRRAVPNAGH